MRKSTFVAMILGMIGGVLFSLGMCMALIPEWNAFKPGIATGTLGLIVLMVMVGVWRKMENKAPIKPSKKTITAILIGIIGSLLFAVGMCLILLWSHMILGIIIGLAGMITLLCLVPFIKGLK